MVVEPRNRLVFPVLIVLLCVLGASGWFLLQSQSPRTDMPLYIAMPLLADQTLHSDCPLAAQGCIVQIEDGPLAITLRPQGLPALTPLTLELAGTFASHANDWLVWFEGQDMEMGRHFFSPKSGPAQSSSDLLYFSGMIPVCSIDERMVWLLNVQFAYNGQLTRVVFEIMTRHDTH